MSGNELKYIHEAFDSNWIAPAGNNIEEFENTLGEYLDIPWVTALNSGTAALHLALICLGVQPGDEVLVSDFTFVASINPIVYRSAVPVFVDSEPDTWNMDPELLEEAIRDRIIKGRKPGAIVLVHLYGMPAKIEEITKIARRYEIPVIEDAAEAMGSTYKGQSVGTFGDIGVFSFNGNKIITTSGGGAIVSHNKEYIEKALYLATQAKDEFPYYQHSHIGYNYRMSNICAGIGRGQMEVLDERVRQRRTNFDFYFNELNGYDSIWFLTETGPAFSNYWLTTFIIEGESVSAEDLRIALEKENIEARPLWKPMHLQPVFKDYPFYGSGHSAKLFRKGLSLPSGSNLTLEDKERVAAIIHRVLNSR
jgi:dTDP-4-amino-4,6-dideoxygalactose transaminase